MLPIFQTSVKELSLMQTKWASQLNPVVANAILQGQQLEQVQLASGDNTINHGLGKNLTGWFIVRQRGPATIYDKQDSNQMQALTLVLNSSASVSVDIWVY